MYTLYVRSTPMPAPCHQSHIVVISSSLSSSLSFAYFVHWLLLLGADSSRTRGRRVGPRWLLGRERQRRTCARLPRWFHVLVLIYNTQIRHDPQSHIVTTVCSPSLLCRRRGQNQTRDNHQNQQLHQTNCAHSPKLHPIIQ